MTKKAKFLFAVFTTLISQVALADNWYLGEWSPDIDYLDKKFGEEYSAIPKNDTQTRAVLDMHYKVEALSLVTISSEELIFRINDIAGQPFQYQPERVNEKSVLINTKNEHGKVVWLIERSTNGICLRNTINSDSEGTYEPYFKNTMCYLKQ